MTAGRPQVVICRASHDDLLAEIAALEANDAGLNSANVEHFFDGPDGAIPTDVLMDAMTADQRYDLVSISDPDE